MYSVVLLGSLTDPRPSFGTRTTSPAGGMWRKRHILWHQLGCKRDVRNEVLNFSFSSSIVLTRISSSSQIKAVRSQTTCGNLTKVEEIVEPRAIFKARQNCKKRKNWYAARAGNWTRISSVTARYTSASVDHYTTRTCCAGVKSIARVILPIPPLEHDRLFTTKV